MEKEDMISALKEIIKDEKYVLSSDVDLLLYGYDASLFRGIPDVIVLPNTTAEVSEIMKFAYREKIPVVARGSGTNLTGGSITEKGGIVIHFSRMDRVVEIDTQNHRAVVEPGIFTLDFKNQLAPYGFVYQPDPASESVSTMGGNFAENSGGPLCFKYGVTTNHMLGAEVVLNNGDVTWVGGKTLDNTGYDLTGLLVGSEGTLAIATKLCVRIMPAPEARKTLLAIYDTLKDAANTVSDIIEDGIIPATLEMLDKLTIEAVEASVHAGYPLDAEAVLLIELDGLKDGMERLADRIIELCKKNKVRDVKAAKNEDERALLWAGRKGAFGAVARLETSYLCNDGTVPRNKLPEVLEKVVAVGKRYNLRIANVFHAGDGNLHPLVLFDDRNKADLEKVKKVGSEILKICVEAGGTISGEHGIGTEKIKEMGLIFSDEDISFKRKVKMVFDPEAIINPGKILPEAA
jgi:glycolate oxidase